MSRVLQEYVTTSGRHVYSCGVQGNYTVKACGNNRIMARELPTLAAVEEWIEMYVGKIDTDYKPRVWVAW